MFGYILLTKAKVYDRETRGTNAALAGYVAKDLNVDGLAAEFVIRDVIIGEDYSFLMDACAFVPRAAVSISAHSPFVCARRLSSLSVLGR